MKRTVDAIDPIYHYADYFVAQNGGPSKLDDFFVCLQSSCAQPFQPINLHNDSTLCNQNKCGSNQCDATCFINYTGNPVAPDTD